MNGFDGAGDEDAPPRHFRARSPRAAPRRSLVEPTYRSRASIWCQLRIGEVQRAILAASGQCRRRHAKSAGWFDAGKDASPSYITSPILSPHLILASLMIDMMTAMKRLPLAADASSPGLTHIGRPSPHTSPSPTAHYLSARIALRRHAAAKARFRGRQRFTYAPRRRHYRALRRGRDDAADDFRRPSRYGRWARGVAMITGQRASMGYRRAAK